MLLAAWGEERRVGQEGSERTVSGKEAGGGGAAGSCRLWKGDSNSIPEAKEPFVGEWHGCS